MRNLLRRSGNGRHIDRPPPRSWREDELWVVDLETTGLNLRRDKMIAYGAVPIRHGRIQLADAVYSLVGIADPVPAPSVRVHYIRTQDLASAPTLEHAVAQLHSLVGDATIVAHCAVIERVLLRRAYQACGLTLPNAFIDTAPLATAALNETIEGGSISLEYAATLLGVPVHCPHHALGDAITTANVLLAVAGRLEQHIAPASLTTAALIDRSIT